MGQTEPTRQSDEILPGIQGAIWVFAVTSTTLIIDLASLANTPALGVANSTVKGSERPNPLGQYLTLIADGANVYYACAQTRAALSGTTFSTTDTNTVNGTTGVVTAKSTVMDVLPSGQLVPFRFPPGPSVNAISTSATPATINGIGPGASAISGQLSNARFIAVQTATGATSTLRVHVSSR